MIKSLLNSFHLLLKLIFKSFINLLFNLFIHPESGEHSEKFLAFRSWMDVTLNTPDLTSHVTLGTTFNL